MGKAKRKQRLYALVYRSVDHRSLRELCLDVRKSALPPKYVPYLPANRFGAGLATFATNTVELLELRHSADYDPLQQFRKSDVRLAVDIASAALSEFSRASSETRRTFLTLLLFPPRRA